MEKLQFPDVQIITGRNEVLAKVIFSEACVKNSVHRGGGSAPNFRGGVSAPNFWGEGGVCSKFSGGVSAPNFGGGGRVSAPNFRGEGGVCSKFWGGGGVSNFRNTVNVWPVCILLECILVFSNFTNIFKEENNSYLPSLVNWSNI